MGAVQKSQTTSKIETSLACLVSVPSSDQLLSSSDQQPIGRAPADATRFARSLMGFAGAETRHEPASDFL
jgi:hypothetical protein